MPNLTQEALEETDQADTLGADPAEVYGHLPSVTKQLYHDRLAKLARRWRLGEDEVSKAALALSSEHRIDPMPERRLCSHVGYYLLDEDGVAVLAHRLGKNSKLDFLNSQKARTSIILLIYLVGSLVLTAGFCSTFIHSRDSILISVLVVPALFVVAVSAVWSWITTWLSHSSQPEPLPRLDLRASITPQYKTAIAIPALLLSKDHVQELVEALETHFHIVNDPNVIFLLLTDLPDSDQEHVTEEGRSVVDFCIQAINELNDKVAHGHRQRFFLLHREHSFSLTQRRWIGWERKRGKLHLLFRYIASGQDAFSVRIGDMQRLREVKYVVVLDEDSGLEKNSIQDLVGTHAHPLNHPHIQDGGNSLSRGYGILQPAVGLIGLKQKNEEQLGPRKDFFQDVFGRSNFCGKGIINVNAYQNVLGDALPEEWVLCHDIVESAVLRTASTLDVRILEPDPKTHETACIRRHRWTRGDWQNSRFLISSLGGRRLTAFGRTLIFQLLINTLRPIAISIAVVRGVTAVHAGLLCLVLVSTSAIYLEDLWIAAIAVKQGQLRKAAGALIHVLLLPVWVLLLVEDSAHAATMSVDAIGRSLFRMITGRKLLDWQTAISVEKCRTRFNICSIHIVLEAVVFLTAGLLILVFGHNIPLSVLLLTWAIHPSLLLSTRSSNS